MKSLASEMRHESRQSTQIVGDALDLVLDRVLAGEAEAWTELVSIVHPMALRLCLHRFYAKSEANEDYARDVATKTLERLRARDFAALLRYREGRQRYPELSFESWLRVVVANLCVDHLRGLPEHQRVREGATRKHLRVVVEELDHDIRVPAQIQDQVDLRRILAWLKAPGFPSKQRAALALWLRGHDATEICKQLHLSNPAEATRLLRAARQRLRRQFEDHR